MEIVITTLVAGIGGALIGAYLTYLGAVRISQSNERQNANAAFYGVMSRPLVTLEREPDTWPFHAVGSHDGLAAAVAFRYYLKGNERRRFDKAWKEYFGEYRREDVASYFPHMYIDSDPKRLPEIQKLFLDRLHTLLEFTGYEK